MPKPFPPQEWPRVRARLERLAREVGLPIDPPKRNVNSRFALETAELVRAQKGDGAAGAFHQAVSRAFFTEHADISKHEVVVPIAQHFGISAPDVDAAWHERRFSPVVDAFIEDGLRTGATGVPAMAWPNRHAIVGMMPPADLVLRLRQD
jgi:predicted DsbA family dithiol-disulfide isomerase